MKADLKLMISTHEKLVKGEAVEKDVDSILLVWESILEIEDKVKSLEVENVTNKNRI